VIDLHLHTTHSDGRLSAADVVREAMQRGLRAIAITDHDVVTGLSEAQAAARDGFEVVPGIEMTAGWDPAGTAERARAVHVLGYFVDPDDACLRAALQRARRLMQEHVDAVLGEVRATGRQLDLADLGRYRNRYAGGAALVLGMLERGVLRGTPPGTGMRLLRLAAAEPRAYDVAEAVRIIHGAGGVASLAHPARLRRGRPLLTASELEPLMSAGFDAIEAWQWIPRGWGSDHYRAVAAELGVLASGGSDDHGKRSRDGRTRLGAQPVPDEMLEALRARRGSPT
jgi:predicted metal-dependent phosphoesterase TrpH